ncbi:MAG TPA: Uma2 family endonuclease [Pseudonocardiaceae bacterium]|nr:Uma2 family endonuclease [Pseudonocardiaceae bacterium]
MRKQAKDILWALRLSAAGDFGGVLAGSEMGSTQSGEPVDHMVEAGSRRDSSVMSAALAHPIGPNTVQDWLDAAPPPDGSKLELIMGYFSVVPPPTGQHQFIGYWLARIIDDALRGAGRIDLHVVPAVGVKVSTAWRTAVIADVVVLNTRPIGSSFTPDQVELVAEVWSPGNKRDERNTKMAAYAGAGIRYFWTVDLNEPTITAYQLRHGEYVPRTTLVAGTAGTIMAAPIPVTVDPADLRP